MNPKSLSNKEHLLKTLLIAGILMPAGILPLVGSTMPVNLQCEYRLNPPGLDESHPRLMWQVQSDERDQGQTAYQILVAGGKEPLENNLGFVGQRQDCQR